MNTAASPTRIEALHAELRNRARRAVMPLVRRIVAVAWERFGVAHDVRWYKCRVCGAPQYWEHAHITLGYAQKLCGGCFPKHEQKGKRFL
ncbi:MAG: hypothetical protein ACHREM_04205 [Polyangiales bacterium]